MDRGAGETDTETVDGAESRGWHRALSRINRACENVCHADSIRGRGSNSLGLLVQLCGRASRQGRWFNGRGRVVHHRSYEGHGTTSVFPVVSCRRRGHRRPIVGSTSVPSRVILNGAA